MASHKFTKKNINLPSNDDDSSTDEDIYRDDSIHMDYDDSDEEYRPKTSNVGKRCAKASSSRQTSTTAAAAGNRLQTYRKPSMSSSTDGNKPIERQPTRRPNPKVFNRNALMARENRRRKKEHLAVLERDMDVFRSENQTLRKTVKSQTSLVEKLKQERLYLKSVIANQTEIMTLLKTIQGNRIPMTSSVLGFVTQQQQQHTSTGENKSMEQQQCCKSDETVSCYGSGTPSSTTTTLSCSEEDIDTNGTVGTDPMLSQAPALIDDHFSFTDFLNSGCSEGDDLLHNTYDNWENILNDDTPFNVPVVAPAATTTTIDNDDDNILSTVNNEHNYFNNNTIASSQKDNSSPTLSSTSSSSSPGICLHLSGGRVSLEFCVTCHKSSQNAWFEEM